MQGLSRRRVAQPQDRNVEHGKGSSEASRLTAQARKKLASLGTTIESLADRLESTDSTSENETNRRRDLVTSLRSRRQQMLLSLKRDANPTTRAALLAGGGEQKPPQETIHTAGLDGQGLVRMQRDLMREQDEQVLQLEQSVERTRHMATSIDEELAVHNRLLDELDEEVTVTHSRMRAAQKRVATILSDSGGCRFSCAAFGLALILTVLIVLLFKLF